MDQIEMAAYLVFQFAFRASEENRIDEAKRLAIKSGEIVCARWDSLD